MSRVLALASALMLAALACGDESGSGHASARARTRAAVEPTPEPEPPPEPPALLLLPWDTKLYVAPEAYAPALTLAPPPKRAEASPDTDEAAADTAAEPSGRVIRVLGKADAAGQWWKLETGPLGDAGSAGPTIEGLDVYALALYVPAGTGADAAAAAVPAPTMVPLLGSATLDPPTQSGLPRPPGLGQEWRVAAGAKVFWPNGKLAGSVRALHAFVSEPKRIDGRERDCFEVRIGPPAKPVTSLCFEPSAITIATPAPPDPIANLLVDDIGLWGGLIGDDPGHAELDDATLGILGGSPNAGLLELLGELDEPGDGLPIDELRAATPDEQLEDE